MFVTCKIELLKLAKLHYLKVTPQSVHCILRLRYGINKHERLLKKSIVHMDEYLGILTLLRIYMYILAISPVEYQQSQTPTPWLQRHVPGEVRPCTDSSLRADGRASSECSQGPTSSQADR